MGNQMQRPELGLTGALESVPGREDLSGSNPLPPKTSHRAGDHTDAVGAAELSLLQRLCPPPGVLAKCHSPSSPLVWRLASALGIHR